MKIATSKFTVQILILCFMVAGLIWPVANASAALRSCRTDPILTFSDGSILTVTATIGTEESNVESVVYRVNVPAGLTLVRTVYTAGGLGSKEVVVLIADQNPGVYQTDTMVMTREKGVQVKAVSSLNPAVYGSDSGTDGEHLHVSLLLSTKPGSSTWATPNTVLAAK